MAQAKITMAGKRPTFASLFGGPPSAAADAPGRVNLIGEHTDYEGGWVLPVAIPRRTRVEIRPREDRLVRAWSANMAAMAAGGESAGTGPGPGGERGILEYRLGGETPGRGWLDYVQGATAALGGRRRSLAGCELRIASAVPPGAGLASSAALLVALLRALRAAFGLAVDDLEIARLARRAENRFVGAPVGIMDPLAASLGDERHALLIDTRDSRRPGWERVALPAGVELAVIHSGIVHHHAGGDYATRRAECRRAARRLGVARLRDLDVADLARIGRLLPAPLDRRVRHVVTENARVLAAVRAIRDGDPARLGQILVAGHRSLAEDFAVSLPEIDLLVELACAHPAVYGARLTGGGFGGAVVVLARPGTARHAASSIAAAYRRATGQAAAVVVPPT